MRPVNPVEKLCEILCSKDGSSISEFVSTLSVEDILESTYEDQTVLSLLVESMFPASEESSGVTDIVGILRGFSQDLGAYVKSYFPDANAVESGISKHRPGGGDLTNKAGVGQGAQRVPKLSSVFIYDIGKSIRIISEKIEAERRVVALKGPEEYVSYLEKVADYITKKRVTYEVRGVVRKASAITALALQYFSSTGNLEEQLAYMEPLKEFLLGFSRYRIDPQMGVYPVHFALSMSGGTHEDKFIEDVISPLLKGVKREELGKEPPSIDTAAVCDQPRAYDIEGNTLLGYALSSPYCSAKTIGLVLKSFPDLDVDPDRKGALSLVELLVNNVPRYAIFCSMGDVYKDYAERRAQVVGELEEAKKTRETSALRSVVRAQRELKEQMLSPSLEAMSRFDRILGVLCGKDRKIGAIRKANLLKQTDRINSRLLVMEMLKSYKDGVDRIREIADENSASADSVVVQNTWQMVSNAASRQNIGAQAAADEVVSVVLQDKGYVRRIGITAARAKKAELRQFRKINRTQQQHEEKVSYGWIYDSGCCSINRFFGVMCDMCKSSAVHFESYCEFYDLVFGAVHEIREKNKASEKISTNAVYCLAVGVPLAAVAANIILIVQNGSILKILLTDVLFSVVAICTLVLVFVMDKAQREVDKSVSKIEQDLEEYVKATYSGRKVETLLEKDQEDARSTLKLAEAVAKDNSSICSSHDTAPLRSLDSEVRQLHDDIFSSVSPSTETRVSTVSIAPWVGRLSCAGESILVR